MQDILLSAKNIFIGFEMPYAWRLATPLNVNEMARAAQMVVGTHDFRAFMSAGSDMEDTVRTVQFFHVTRSGEDILFHICADGYLYNMVRILVGTLVEVGAGRMVAEKMADVLKSGNRSLAGDTVPAKGLFLYKVHYPDEGKKKEL